MGMRIMPMNQHQTLRVVAAPRQIVEVNIIERDEA
jgi:hypothetical protein